MLSEKEYYIVSVKLREVKAFDGHVLTREGEEGWLEKDQESPQIGSVKKYATQFKIPPTKHVISSFDGMPWYKRIIPDSETIYKIREKVIYEYEEEIVE